jgi:hypothetical protein
LSTLIVPTIYVGKVDCSANKQRSAKNERRLSVHISRHTQKAKANSTLQSHSAPTIFDKDPRIRFSWHEHVESQAPPADKPKRAMTPLMLRRTSIKAVRIN